MMIEVGDRRPVACMHSNVVKKGMTKRQNWPGSTRSTRPSRIHVSAWAKAAGP